MIGKLQYNDVTNISNELKTCSETLKDLIQDKNNLDLENFVTIIERYTKYLDSIVEMNKDADLALQDLNTK